MKFLKPQILYLFFLVIQAGNNKYLNPEYKLALKKSKKDPNNENIVFHALPLMPWCYFLKPKLKLTTYSRI